MSIINPLAFDSVEEFKAALKEDGLKRGWTLMSDESDEVTHSVVEDILTHSGVKGMKWGVRNEKNRSSAVSVKDKGKRLKTSGGKGLPANPTAVRARVIGQKAKGSGLKSLTDQELKDYANRLNLEQNAKRLMNEDRPFAQRFVLKVLGQTGQNQANEATRAGSSKAVKAILKRRR